MTKAIGAFHIVEKLSSQIVGPALGRHVFGHQIPFVDDENARFVIGLNVVAQLPVDLADSFAAIKHHQDHIGMTNAAVGPMRTVEFNVGADAFASPQARRIDRDHGFPVQFKSNVDAIRVVPATSLTIIRSDSTSVLMNVLLPTFRRPTMANFISGSLRFSLVDFLL